MMGLYYGKPCNPSCYYYKKCDYCRKQSAMFPFLGKGLLKDCGDKLFCSQNFYCKYAQYSWNSTSTKICQNMNS